MQVLLSLLSDALETRGSSPTPGSLFCTSWLSVQEGPCPGGSSSETVRLQAQGTCPPDVKGFLTLFLGATSFASTLRGSPLHPPCHQHLGWSPPCLTSLGCPTLEDEGGRAPSAPGEVVLSAFFPSTQPRIPTLPSFSQDLTPCRHSGSVPEEPRAQKAAAWVNLEDSKLTQSHCGWKHCYRLWCITSQSRETPRMTSRFPWKVRTRRNPRGRRWGPPGEGSPAWHPGLGEREQGAGQKEAGV